MCAQDWIRTSTPLRALRPEHSASTNFATWAFQIYYKIRKELVDFPKLPAFQRCVFLNSGCKDNRKSETAKKLTKILSEKTDYQPPIAIPPPVPFWKEPF